MWQRADPLEAFDVPVDTSTLPPDLEALAAEVDDSVAGIFGPGSTTWYVNRESALLLAGHAAILLQLAHPKVAAGVGDHSDFAADPVGRFQRTFAIVDSMVFGDLETALEAALIARHLHAGVTGSLGEDVGPYEHGEAYSALDPELLLWVHATLLDQAMTAYEAYVGTLTTAERESFYAEAIAFGRLFGVPAEAYPDTLEEFWSWYHSIIETEVAVGDRGRSLATILFEQSPGPTRLSRFLAAATMPPAVRRAYDLEWSNRSQRRFDRWARGIHLGLRVAPKRVRLNGQYRAARKRLQRSREQ